MAGFKLRRPQSQYKKITASIAKSEIDWVAPTLTLGALFFGVVCAIAHHLFYASLDGKQVHNDSLKVLGSTILQQQINITAGTIFAFLVNFALGTALTTAYAQVFWRALLYRKSTLETWDAAFSATANVFFIGKVWIWRHFPLLCAFAVIAWLLPFATTFPPGTLNVGFKPISPPQTITQQVPNVGFASLNYVGSMPHGPYGGPDGEDSQLDTSFSYNGPSSPVQIITNQVAGTGALLPITAPYANASYSLRFPGPAVACETVPPFLQKRVSESVKASSDCSGVGVLGYSAWQNGNQGTGLSSNVSSSFSALNSGGIAFNLIAYPHMMDVVNSTDGGYGEISYIAACHGNDALDNPARWQDSTILQCRLRNVTYSVDFNFTNGEQDIRISTQPLNPGPIQRITLLAGDGTAYASQGDISDNVDCTVLSGVFLPGNNNPNVTCIVQPWILNTLSYQSIFDAFENLLNGSVTRGLAVIEPNTQTTIQNTILVNTPELSYLSQYSLQAFPNVEVQPLQAYVQVGGFPDYRGLVTNFDAKPFPPLAQTLETLFQNITVSLMSSPALQPNPASAFAPQPVEVTLNNLHLVYEYSAATLWLAYGIAIGFALLVTAFGIRAILVSEASYSTDFSTIFRISRSMSISEEVKPGDTDGRDPLPKYLREAKVWLEARHAPLGEVKIDTSSVQKHDDPQGDHSDSYHVDDHDEDGDEDSTHVPLSPNSIEMTAGIGRGSHPARTW